MNNFDNVQGHAQNKDFFSWYQQSQLDMLANLQDVKEKKAQAFIKEEFDAFDVARSEFGKEVDEFKGYLLGITSPAYVANLSEVTIRDSLYPDAVYKLKEENQNAIWYLLGAGALLYWWIR